MSETARIESIAELRAFRVALIKFVDACNVALGDAESDMQRTYQWLERDQIAYWTGQLAKRAELVARAKEALRGKKLYKSPTGAAQSVVDEEKALRIALRMHEEAEQKIVACKQWARRLQKEIMMYKGGVSRFASVLGGDVPRALAKLDAMAAALEAYATLAAGGGGGAGGVAPAGAFSGDFAGPSMSRSPEQVSPAYRTIPDIAELRAAVPPSEVRAAAPAADIRDEAWLLPPLTSGARRQLKELNQTPTETPDDDTLVVAKGAWSAERIYLERRTPARPGESGWYIASVGWTGIVALHTVRIRDLLEMRPDFREFLTFPENYLVLIDMDGIRAIFTPTGDNLWPAKPDAPDEKPATG